MLMILAGPVAASGFPAKTEVLGEKLERCGQAELKAYRFVGVGDAALYRQGCERDWVNLPDTALLLWFRYSRDIPATAFVQSAEKLLQRNGVDLRSDELALFHQAYRDIHPGDSYRLLYRPGMGLLLYQNDTALAKLISEPLAHQYLRIWLGDDPFDERVKGQLLGLQAR